MPNAPRRICQCGRIVQGKCGACHQIKRKKRERYRGTAAQRGYNYRWQQAAKRFLKENPLCVHCLEEEITKAANVVDHKVPHKGNQELFWDESNWQSLCTTHHNRKTATEDGGFGRS